MNEAYIYDSVRTPRGKGRETGALHKVAPVELLKTLFDALAERGGLDPAAIDDVVLGCVTQMGDQGGNIAKVAALYAGLASRVSGITINRYCASGLDALNFSALKVQGGIDDLVAAGGVESMSRVPMLSDKGSFYTDPALIRAARFVPMGVAADLIATLDGITREECDAYACASQQRAASARENGFFSRSIIPVCGAGPEPLLSSDENIRADVTPELLGGFEPSFAGYGKHYVEVFRSAFERFSEFEHVHHKGNSPGMVDGAALILLGSRDAGRQHGLEPRARIRSMANASGSELLGLTGGIDAAQKLIDKARMQASDVDLFEFNEAFAATSIRFPRALGVDPETVNVNGGAIALGHPMGASGAMLVGTVLDELERRDLSLGLVTISGAAGIGTATLIERV